MKLFNFQIVILFTFILLKSVVHSEEISVIPGPVTCEYKDNDINEKYNVDTDTTINCSGASCKVNGKGVTASNGQVSITTAGTYILKGSMEGQVRIEATKDDFIHLILENTTINSNDGPALYAISANKVTLTLVGENTLKDSSKYTVVNEEPDACLFIDSDLSINGSGSLKVTGNYSDAIRCKKDLKIVNGNITIPNAIQRGIKAKNSICIKDGDINVTSNNSAIKVTRQDKPEKGYIVIDGGNIVISTNNDAIHAETHFTIRDGNVDIKSCKEGIEAQMVDILGGEINLIASDDGINASKITEKDDNNTTTTNNNNNRNMFNMPATGTDGSVYINIVGGKHHITITGIDVDAIDSNGVLYIGSEAQVYISIEGSIYGNMAALDAEGSNSIVSDATVIVAATGGMGGMGGGGPWGPPQNNNSTNSDTMNFPPPNGNDKTKENNGFNPQFPPNGNNTMNDFPPPPPPDGNLNGGNPPPPPPDGNMNGGNGFSSPPPNSNMNGGNGFSSPPPNGNMNGGNGYPPPPPPPNGNIDGGSGFPSPPPPPPPNGNANGGQPPPPMNESGKVYQPFIQTSINTQKAGTEITIKDAKGNVVASYTPNVSYSELLITSPSMKANEAYTIITGSDSVTVNASAGESGSVNSPSVSSPTDTVVHSSLLSNSSKIQQKYLTTFILLIFAIFIIQ